MTRFPFLSIVVIILIVANVSLFWQDNLIVTAIFLTILSLTFWFWHTRKDITFFTIGLVVGPSMEMVPVYFGAWVYSNPTFLIPMWLPLGWGIAGIILGRLSDYFTEKWRSGR